MNRFKNLCVSDSSSDDEQQTQQSFQRGRVRENKRFVQVTVNNNKRDKSSQQNTKQLSILTKPLKPQNKLLLIQPTSSLNLIIQPNQYPSNTSLDMSQKFIRQQIKPVQQQMKHYLQKMKSIIQERKKFINALTAAGRDLGKVEKRIEEIKVKNERNQVKEEITHNKQEQVSNTHKSIPQVSEFQLMQKLQQKINLHISKLMTQHQKTVQLLLLARKQIDKYYQKIKFTFLDTNSISLYEEQTQSHVQYGIEQVYSIIQQADKLINQHTAFAIIRIIAK